MSAYDELAHQCERRGWRLCLCGSYSAGKNLSGLTVNNLAVRTHPRHGRELLAEAGAGPRFDDLEAAAIACARSLADGGHIE
jgi:hypothetical protein